jgi:hypothetical protein
MEKFYFKFMVPLIRNTWKVLKCGVGEGWKRLVGLIM